MDKSPSTAGTHWHSHVNEQVIDEQYLAAHLTAGV
jgi:hypothetical protein